MPNPNASPKNYLDDNNGSGTNYGQSINDGSEAWGNDNDGTSYPSKGNYDTKTCKLVINYNANGGSNPPSSIVKTYSGTKKAITLEAIVTGKPDDMIRTNYNFLGWSTSSSGSVVHNPGDTITKSWAENASGTDTHNLYAVWTTNPIIIYKPDENTNESSLAYPDKYSEALLNEAVNLKGALFTRTGYTQTGWQTLDGSQTYDLGQSYTAISTTPIELYPIWSANIYSLTFKANGPEVPDQVYSVTYDSDVSIPEALFYREGYYTLEWNESADGTGLNWFPGATYIFQRAEDITLYTIWSGNKYYVFYDDGSVEIPELNDFGVLYTTNLSLDENDNLYSTTNDLHVNQNGILYGSYANVMRYFLDENLSENYSVAIYGSPFYTDRHPISKENYSFDGWEANDGTILTKQNVWMDAYSFGKDPIWYRMENAVLKPIWSEKYPYGKIFFGRKESTDYGIVIEEPPAYTWPERNYKHDNVNGKNGDEITDFKNYKNVNKKYKIAVINKAGFYEGASRLSDFLHRYYDGRYTRLEDSYEPDIYMKAIYEESGEVENLLEKAGRAEITFNCKPQKFLLSGDRENEVVDPITYIWNPTNYPSAPIIKIKGSGTIYFMGRPDQTSNDGASDRKQVILHVANSYNEIILDCETCDAVNSVGVNMNNFVSFDEPIRLYPSKNWIIYEGSIEHMSIIPRWWRV